VSDPKTRVDLERAIEDQPDDLNRYLVLADALGSAGSRHGELIVLQSRAQQTRDEAAKKVLLERADALFRELRKSLLSPSLDTDQPLFDYSWRWGFIETLSVRYWHHDAFEDVYKALARVLASPALRFLRALKVIEPTTTLLELLEETVLPVVTELELHGLAPTLQGPFGPLEVIDQAFPMLRRLRLESLPVLWGEARLRGLEALHLRHADPALDTVSWLAAAKWPSLHELELNVEAMPLLNAQTFPALTSVHLWLPDETVVAPVLDLLRRPLRRLRLSGPEPIALAQALASQPKPDVEWLELQIEAEQLPAELRRALPNLSK
jgi:hypothetical protein